MNSLSPAWQTEKNRFELALRLIAVEARTHTIKTCTGLSDDRIRKIYGRYFKGRTDITVRRRRGKSPCQISHFVRNPERQLQATTLFYLYCASGLVRIRSDGTATGCWPRPDVEYGHRLCRAFETYVHMHREPLYNFEWAWALLQAISRSDELRLSVCSDCRLAYVHDSYAIDYRCCPACEIVKNRTRRPGSSAFARA